MEGSTFHIMIYCPNQMTVGLWKGPGGMADTRSNILIRIARRPFRWFMCVWLGLTILWLLSGFMGYKWERHPSTPPVPEAVPYHKFLPGGSRHAALPEYDLASEVVPVYDETLATEDYVYSIWSYSRNDERIIAIQKATYWGYGWPEDWVWSHSTYWFDVTDPSVGIEPARYPVADHPFFQERPNQVWWTWMVNDETGMVVVAINWEPVWGAMFGLEALTGIIVLLIWAWQQVQWHRRRRNLRCPNCSYDMRGGPERVCPECGTAYYESITAWLESVGVRRTLRTGQWIVAFTLLFLLALITLLLASHQNESLPTLESRLAFYTKYTDTEGVIGGSPAEYRDVQISGHAFGWPHSFLVIRDVQAWKFMPGHEPTPVPMDYTSDYFHDSTSVWWSQRGQDGTMRRDFDLQWRTAAMELGAVQMLAIWMTGFFAFLHSRLKKKACESPEAE